MSNYLDGCNTAHERMTAELQQMHEWIDGKRSWTNLGPHEPYTPDVIAVMDTQEVIKHAVAAHAYGVLDGFGIPLDSSRSHDHDREVLTLCLVKWESLPEPKPDLPTWLNGASNALLIQREMTI